MASNTEGILKRANFFNSQREALARKDGILTSIPATPEELLVQLSRLFNKKIDRIYTVEGGMVADVEIIRDNDVLWVREETVDQKVTPYKTEITRGSRASESDFYLKPCIQGIVEDDAPFKADWVQLNVGGRIFATTRATLTGDQNSMLARMFSEENTSWHSATDSRGAYLFDRSPDYFEPILNFLRHGRLIINPTVNSEGVLEEAKFFGVTKVIEQLEPIVEVHKLDASGHINRKEFLNMIGRTSSSSTLRCQGFNLYGVDLSNLDLQNINFKKADLQYCILKGANLTNCSLEYANLEGAILDGATIQCANLTRATLDRASLKGCNFDVKLGTNVSMVGASCREAVFDGSQMNKVNLPVACCKGASFKGCSLREATCAGTDLEGCDFTGSDLHGANLRGANLKDTNFENISGPGLHMSQTLNLTGGQGGRYRDAEQQ